MSKDSSSKYSFKHAIHWLKQKSKATVSRLFDLNTRWFLLFWRYERLEVSKIILRANSEHPFDFNFNCLKKEKIFGMQERTLSTKEYILTFTLFD